MKKHLFTALCLVFAIGLSSCDVDTSQNLSSSTTPNSEVIAYKNGDPIPGQYIVVLKDKVRSVEGFIAEALPSKREEQAMYVYDEMNGFQGFAMKLSDSEVRDLNSNPNVSYVEQDRFVILDNPRLGVEAGGKPGGGGGSTPQTTPWGITRVGGGVSGVGLKACVIDTGVDLDHPDLTVDTANSRTFITSGRDANSADDGNGHGTHVSGTIGAKNNTIGVIGVAAGATIVGVKVLNSQGSGSNSGVIAGINYVGTGSTGCTVANMSLGGGFSQAINDAVIAASGSIKFALAAGNESTSATTKSPASANGANIYTISAFANGGGFASFSNYGNPPVDFAEPGVSINSTWMGGGYNTISGTSMASPHAAGLLLLGPIRAGGTVTGDPDGNADTIGIH